LILLISLDLHNDIFIVIFIQLGASQQQVAAERAERALAEKLAEAQARLASAAETERLCRAQSATLLSQNSGLQAEVTTLSSNVRELRAHNEDLQRCKDRSVVMFSEYRWSHFVELSSLFIYFTYKEKKIKC
jgi:hypothetical protein